MIENCYGGLEIDAAIAREVQNSTICKIEVNYGTLMQPVFLIVRLIDTVSATIDLLGGPIVRTVHYVVKPPAPLVTDAASENSISSPGKLSADVSQIMRLQQLVTQKANSSILFRLHDTSSSSSSSSQLLAPMTFENFCLKSKHQNEPNTRRAWDAIITFVCTPLNMLMTVEQFDNIKSPVYEFMSKLAVCFNFILPWAENIEVGLRTFLFYSYLLYCYCHIYSAFI